MHALTEAGFPSDSISVLALADGRIEEVPLEEHPTGKEGAAAEGAGGGLRALAVWKTEADFPAGELEPDTIVVGASTSEDRVEAAREVLESSPGRKLEVKATAADA